jgi:hypothetical protein
MNPLKRGGRIHFEEADFFQDLSVERLKRVRCLSAHLEDLGFEEYLEVELPKTLGTCLEFSPSVSED